MKSSTSFIVDRRQALAGLASFLSASLVLGGCVTSRVSADKGPLYSAVKVDVEAVRAKGIGRYADKIGFYQKRALDDLYRDVIAPARALPVLTVEVHSIIMGTESDDGPFDMGNRHITMFPSVSTTDWLEGYAVLSKGGQEIKRVKVLTSYRRRGNQVWSMAEDEKRLSELTESFALHVRIELGD